MSDRKQQGAVPATLGSLRWSGLLEIGLLSLALLVADSWFFEGTRFAGWTPNPLWLLVLLPAVQYGTKEALVGASAAAACLLLGNLPQQSLSQDFYQYLFAVLRLPLLWFVAAVVFGEMRMRHLRERDELRQSLAKSETRSDELALAYQRLNELKGSLETRVAAQLRTVTTLYRASQAIERLDPDEVLLGVADLVRTVIHTEKFSLYILREDLLDAVIQDGWVTEDRYSRSFGASSPLFQEVVGRQRLLCAASADDERILSGEGILAGPLVNDGAVLGMLKIEQLGFLDLGTGSVQNFRILCEWIATAYDRALRHDAAERDRVHAETQLYSQNFLSRQTEYVSILARRLGFDLCSIRIRLTNAADLSPAALEQVPPLLRETVASVLRKTDLAFHCDEEGFRYALLLPGTPKEKARVVIRKMRLGLAKRKEGDLGKARFSFSTRTVHRYDRPELYQKNLFPRQTEFLANLSRRFGFDVAMVVFRATNPHELVEEDRVLIQGAINLAVSTVLPEEIAGFTYEREDWNYPIVLPSSAVDDAQCFAETIQVFIDKYLSDRRSRALMAFTVQSIGRSESQGSAEVAHA